MTAIARPLVNDRREIFGWAMYDWANSAFSTTVITVFLGPFLTAITKAAADPQGLVYLFGVPIRYDSYFTYCISASVLLQVTFLPSSAPWPTTRICANDSCSSSA
jgi:UMF1 family MFS transporter